MGTMGNRGFQAGEGGGIKPNIRVNYPVPVHHASTRPLGTKKLPVLNLEMLETSMMA